VQPRPLLAGGEVEVGLRPAPRPRVLGAVELGAAHPVLLGELAGVLDAHAPLLGGVDEEQATEAPERLPAEVLLALLVEQQHAATTVGGLRRGDETGQAGSDDDDVGVHACSFVCEPGAGSLSPRMHSQGARDHGLHHLVSNDVACK
jgi:hypothetical protein